MSAINYSHLDALTDSLLRERARLGEAKTQREIIFRTHCIAMKEKEIASERAFLGIAPEVEMTDDELLSALGAEVSA
jgi:hypothetical protein